MSPYGIWLSYNNQEEGFQLPVMPGKVQVTGKGAGTGYEVYGMGQINVIQSPGLVEYSLESFFPVQAYPFITAHYVFEPYYYIRLIEKWRKTKRPIRFVYAGATMDINTAASIEQFDWSETAGESGDIQFTLALKEYRFYAAQRVTVSDGETVKEEPVRADERVVPAFYTTLPGDTLWSISRTLYGAPERGTEIRSLNKLIDAQAKGGLPAGMVLKLPRAGGRGDA